MEDAQNDDSTSTTYNTTNTPVPPSANSPSNVPSSKKRRGSTSTSRGVANLTPEQLAKKRANDREAQRAIRERTKNQIEALERRIEQLTAQQPYQDLQHVVRQKEAVEAENEEIKRRLSSVLGVLQSIVGGCASGDPITASYSNGHHGPQSTDSARGTPLHHSDSLPPVPSPFPEGRPGTSTSSRPMVSSQTYWPTPPILSHPTPNPHSTNFIPVNALDRPHRDPLFLTPDLTSAGEKPPLNYLLDARHHHPIDPRHQHPFPHATSPHLPLPTPPPFPHPPLLPYPTSPPSSPHAFSTPIKNTPPTCPLDGLLLNFLARTHQKAHQGTPLPLLLGPPYPSFSTLLNPHHPSHPLSKVFTDMLQTFPDLDGLPEQVAVLLVMFLVARWQISPTRENYDRLPEWMVPRVGQTVRAHPAWVDHLPWPGMRDRLVEEFERYPFEDFFVSFTKTLSLNWGGAGGDVLVRDEAGGDGGLGEWRVSERFERHLGELGNWSLGREFEEAMPGLAGMARIVGGK